MIRNYICAALVLLVCRCVACAGPLTPVPFPTADLKHPITIYNWAPGPSSVRRVSFAEAPQRGMLMVNAPLEACPANMPESNLRLSMLFFFLAHQHFPNPPVRVSVTLEPRPFLIEGAVPSCGTQKGLLLIHPQR